MGLTVIVFCVTTLAYVFVSVEGQYVLTTSCGVSVQAGGSCTLTCDTQGVAAAGIQWLNGSAPTAITDTDCKNVGNLPKPDYTANCNNAKTEFTLTFTNAIYGRDAVEWACDSAFGGSKSNIIAAGTLVTVPLTLVTITRTSTITCTTLSKPEAEIKLIESTNHQVVKTESNFAEEYGGRMTTLTYNLNDTSSYYCHADNGVVQINSTVSSPSETSTTPGPTTSNSTENCTCENPSTPANCTCEDLPTSENATENCTCVKCPIWYRRITTNKCVCECWIDVQLTVLVVVVTLVVLLITAIIVVVFRNRESMHHSHHTKDNETDRTQTCCYNI